jgi:hypothetical protein
VFSPTLSLTILPDVGVVYCAALQKLTAFHRRAGDRHRTRSRGQADPLHTFAAHFRARQSIQRHMRPTTPTETKPTSSIRRNARHVRARPWASIGGLFASAGASSNLSTANRINRIDLHDSRLCAPVGGLVQRILSYRPPTTPTCTRWLQIPYSMPLRGKYSEPRMLAASIPACMRHLHR